jgi:hypothetical protein
MVLMVAMMGGGGSDPSPGHAAAGYRFIVRLDGVSGAPDGAAVHSAPQLLLVGQVMNNVTVTLNVVGAPAVSTTERGTDLIIDIDRVQAPGLKTQTTPRLPALARPCGGDATDAMHHPATAARKSCRVNFLLMLKQGIFAIIVTIGCPLEWQSFARNPAPQQACFRVLEPL